jgi:hypothetical protein
MENQRKGCLGKLAIGAVVCVILAFSAAWLSMAPFRRAVEIRILLESRFGSQESFTPNPYGTVAPDRLQTFCAVRRQLLDACETLRSAEDGMLALEGLDGQDQIARKDFVRDALKTVRGGMSLGPVMGGFFETRNRALLEAGMGLGEYTYIYIVSYHDRLVKRKYEARLFDGPPVNQRVLRALHTMLARQLEAAREQQVSPDLLAALEAEVRAMADDPARFPWSDGLPEAVAASIAPRREELDGLFCDVAAPLELGRNRRHGPGIETG